MNKPNIESYGYINGRYVDDMNDVIDPMIDALIDSTEQMKACRNILDREYGEGFDRLYSAIDKNKEALKKAGVEL